MVWAFISYVALKTAIVGVVAIEELEHLLDALAGVLLTHLAGHHLEGLGEDQIEDTRNHRLTRA